MESAVSKWKVELTHVGVESWVARFDTEEAAFDCAQLIRHGMAAGHTVEVSRDIPALDRWKPDAADIMVMRDLWARRNGDGIRTGNIAAIKFARLKAGCGLKEAKDWCDEHLG